VGVSPEEVSVALIELDLDAPPAPVVSRPPIRYYRYAGLLLTAILALVLGGAATTASHVIWRSAGSFALSGPDTSFQLLGDRLYTLDTAGDQRMITAWSMSPLRQLWTTSTPLTRDPSSGALIRDGNVYLTGAGAYTLLQTPVGTTVLDNATGAIRWATATPVLAADGVGIVQETRFRPGTGYDETSGNPGPLYWSSTGQPHTEPPEQTTVRALDLATGRPLWSADEHGSVYVVPAAGDATGFVVVAADDLTERAAATGRIIRQHPLTVGDVSYPDVDGDVLLLRHQEPDGSGVATAYSLDTLAPIWRLTEPADTGNGSSCTDLPCRADASGVTVLDPRRGTPLWHAGTFVQLIRRGAGTLQIQGASGLPQRLRDPRHGVVLAQLSDWDSVADSDPDDPIVLFRAEPPDGHAAFAVVPPGGHGVQPLGRAAGQVRECSADDRHIVCRTGGAIQVWSYRT
jgi:outer membrane protein assembly factor BamB